MIQKEIQDIKNFDTVTKIILAVILLGMCMVMYGLYTVSTL